MTPNEALAQFSKCGGALHHLARRFHGLTRESKESVINAMIAGRDAEAAIRKAKREERTK